MVSLDQLRSTDTYSLLDATEFFEAFSKRLVCGVPCEASAEESVSRRLTKQFQACIPDEEFRHQS